MENIGNSNIPPEQAPKSPESLEEQVARLEKENARLKNRIRVLDRAHQYMTRDLEEASQDAFYDKLTGLMNRRTFDTKIKEYWDSVHEENTTSERRKIENKESLVLVIFDIDHFKNVNDKFGHKAGDLILQTVAEEIKSYVRGDDIVARWGGEEIAVVFVGATVDQAEVKANFIRGKIEQLSFKKFPKLKVTVSAGLASSSDFIDGEYLFKAADDALRKSKRGDQKGDRNRVTRYSKYLGEK